jgi:RNA polymerase sigma-70 factor (ECF subfamily)
MGNVEHEAMTSMSMIEVHALIDHLTEAQRDVLLLRVVGDLSVTETAKVLDTTEGAVRALQNRALRDLRKDLMGDA